MHTNACVRFVTESEGRNHTLPMTGQVSVIICPALTARMHVTSLRHSCNYNNYGNYSSIWTSDTRAHLPLSCELTERKCPRVDGSLTAGIFGSLWAEVVATIQNPLNATTATGRGLWDRTILLSKGIRAHTTWPLSFPECVCVCVSQMTRLPVLAFSSRDGFTDDGDGWGWNFKWSVNWAHFNTIH